MNRAVEAMNPDMKFALQFVWKCTSPVVSSIVPEERLLELKKEPVAGWSKESEYNKMLEG